MSIGLQKASLWKRFSAFLFDIMLVISLALAFMLGLSIIMNYDKHADTLQGHLQFYEQKYELPDYTEEEYNALPQEEKLAYDSLQEKIFTDFFKDPAVSETMTKLVTLVLVAASISILLGYLIVFFLVPLLFKNGQTLGKKAFSIAVMRTNSVKVSNPVLFIRMFVGMFVIETMFPLLLLALTVVRVLGIIGVITPILLLILEAVVMIATSTNSAIHDLLCDTVVVDMASQQIFESEEALLEYKKRIALKKKATETESAISESPIDSKNVSNEN